MHVYRVALTPDAAVEVEDSGNVVLVTPERRITITNVQHWADELAIARQTARALDNDVDPATRDPYAYPAGYDTVTDAHGA